MTVQDIQLPGRRSIGDYALTEAFQAVRDLEHAGINADLRALHGRYAIFVESHQYDAARRLLNA
jgi:hypothetical protein